MNEEINSFLKNKLKAVFLDADGTFFDGYETRLEIDKKVVISKRRHFHDGQGLSFMRALGIRILFVSGEGEPLNSLVGKFNSLSSVKKGEWKPVEYVSRVSGQGKVDAIEKWLEENNLSWGECLYVGDDVNDLSVMRKVQKEKGLVFAPQNATRKVLEIADHVSKKSSGNGAIREIAEIILDAKDVDELTLPAS